MKKSLLFFLGFFLFFSSASQYFFNFPVFYEKHVVLAQDIEEELRFLEMRRREVIEDIKILEREGAEPEVIDELHQELENLNIQEQNLHFELENREKDLDRNFHPREDLGEKEFLERENKEDIRSRVAEEDASIWSAWRQDYFWEALGVLVTVGGGSLAWYLTRRKKRNFSRYFEMLDNTYGSFKMKARRCEAELYRVRDIIDEALKEGKIEQSLYELLVQRLNKYLAEVREQIIREEAGNLPVDLIGKIEQMMKDGQVSPEEYNKFIKIINETTAITGEQKNYLTAMMQDWHKKQG